MKPNAFKTLEMTAILIRLGLSSSMKFFVCLLTTFFNNILFIVMSQGMMPRLAPNSWAQVAGSTGVRVIMPN
jgi:hypothetical protein